MNGEIIKKVRAVAGLLTILTLLGMIIGDFVFHDLHLSNRSIVLLTSMASALLGLDLMMQNKQKFADVFIAALKEWSSDDN